MNFPILGGRRIVFMANTFSPRCRVVNKYRESYDIDICRPGPWGNPFKLGSRYGKKKLDRDSCLEVYQGYLFESSGGLAVLAKAGQLRGKRLGCVCKPKKCHGDVLAEFVNSLPTEINQFRGEYEWLSNFYVEPDGTHVEGEYQASKCGDDTAAVRRFFSQKRMDWLPPAECKRTGRTVKLRSDWEDVKLEIMIRFVRQKFKDHPELAKKLILTADAELVHGVWHCDSYWGICGRGVACRKGIHDGTTGENTLGQILMGLRSELVEAL